MKQFIIQNAKCIIDRTMKKTNIFAILMLGIMTLGFNACQDGDWDPVTDYKLWNDTIDFNNVIPIA